MRKLFFPILLISIQSFSQDIAELDKRHGFKDIKLGFPIDSVVGYKLQKEFKEKDEFPAKLYSVENREYETIGEVKVNKVELKTYNDLIYEIKVVTNKDSRLMKALESIYGKADYDVKNDTYFWKTESLILKFHSEGKNRLVLLYISYSLQRTMKEDKNKKVEDIANDF
jgi:hypothetical protein